MKIPLIRIGNSQGIRIPASIIKQCDFENMLEVNVRHKAMVVTAAFGVREGWQELTEAENKDHPFDEKGEWEW